MRRLGDFYSWQRFIIQAATATICLKQTQQSRKHNSTKKPKFRIWVSYVCKQNVWYSNVSSVVFVTGQSGVWYLNNVRKVSVSNLNTERAEVLRVSYTERVSWRTTLGDLDLLRAVSSRTWLLGCVCGMDANNRML